MSGRGVELAYAAGWRLVRAVPERVGAAAFRAAADAAYLRGGPAVRRLRANLRRVVGPQPPDAELDRLVRAGLRSYARYWLEAFRLPAFTPAQIRQRFRLAGEELLAKAMADGVGAVVALPHAGNWDLAGAWAVGNGWRLTTVAERLRPEGLYERFVAFRRGLGMRIIPLRGGERPPLVLLDESLRDNHLVALLADRDLSARGIEVDFFGGRTRMPAGPALLALRTGAPLFVVDMWYEPDAACGRLRGPLPVPEEGTLDQRVRVLTQRIADHLAAGIAAHPTDWHMLQRLWLDDGDGDPAAPKRPRA
ncbi:MAG TPA: phosphatidylinositol mannoside acyltransferase [Natronosporangium sp.]|nr:phosphatidylinositol mannoside acyltransferase [Natronosporangium sp.]